MRPLGGIPREGAESRFVTGSQETGPTGNFHGPPFAGEGSGRRAQRSHPPTPPPRKGRGFSFEASAGQRGKDGGAGRGPMAPSSPPPSLPLRPPGGGPGLLSPGPERRPRRRRATGVRSPPGRLAFAEPHRDRLPPRAGGKARRGDEVLQLSPPGGASSPGRRDRGPRRGADRGGRAGPRPVHDGRQPHREGHSPP